MQPAPRRPGDFRGLCQGGFRGGRIPQVAFEIDDRRLLDEVFIDIRFGQILAGAQEGIHRALAVGCHEHETAPAGWAILREWRRKIDIGGTDIMGERGRRASAFTLPMKAALQPRLAAPMTVLAADPPETMVAGPMAL